MNTLVLAETVGRTQLSLTILYASKAAREGALATGMTVGMEASFGLLDELLASLSVR